MTQRPANRSIYIPAREVPQLQEIEEMCRDLGTNLSAAVVEALHLWKETNARRHLLAALEQDGRRLEELKASPGKAASRERAELEAHIERLARRLRHLESTTPQAERLSALGQALLALAVEQCPVELARLLAVSQAGPPAGRPLTPEAEAQTYDF
jgi:C4-dicarboxylate-specific signal transduction histidine kinase